MPHNCTQQSLCPRYMTSLCGLPFCLRDGGGGTWLPEATRRQTPWLSAWQLSAELVVAQAF